MKKNDLVTLINAIKNSDMNITEKTELLEFVNERLDKIVKYVNCVVSMSVQGIFLPQLKEGEEFRYAWEELDKGRRIAHDACIAACNQINRVCGMVAINKICNIDTSDRNAVAEYAGETVMELFYAEIKEHCTFDELIEKCVEEDTRFPVKGGFVD